MLASSLDSLLFLLTVFPLSEAMSEPNSLFAFNMSRRVKLLLPMMLCSIAFDKSSSLGHINICCKSQTFSARLSSNCDIPESSSADLLCSVVSHPITVMKIHPPFSVCSMLSQYKFVLLAEVEAEVFSFFIKHIKCVVNCSIHIYTIRFGYERQR